MIKTLWASVQGNPRFMQRVNGWLAVFFCVLIPPSFVFGWVNSTAYVSALSLWALVSGHWSAWQAARVEVKQQEEAERRDAEDLPARVVEEIVSQTTVEPEPSDT